MAGVSGTLANSSIGVSCALIISRLSSCKSGNSCRQSSKKCTWSRRPSQTPLAIPAGLRADTLKPISSNSSRRAAASGVSPGRIPPPGRCHVWMPPFAQEGYERLDHVIGCGHVSGLQVRPDMAAGRYGDMRTWRKSLVRALSSLASVAFPGPDLTDQLTLPFVDLLTRPTFPTPRRPMLAQIAATVGTRKSSPFASMAQTERAILFEPRRVSRRLRLLRGWSHGNQENSEELLA